jgi:alpha-beta hydrolase superfamily lysophospholipase
MDIILIPGLWLTARSWDDVGARLEDAGHATHALTLPGMESVDADRSTVTRQQHVDAVVAEVDAVERGAGVLLVGHSMGGVLAWAAADARLDRIAGVVFVASEPGIPEQSESMFPVQGDDVPVTMVTAEYDSAQLRQWTDAREPGTEEIARLRDVTWVDLHSGHWPQYSRVDDTARVILEAASRA